MLGWLVSEWAHHSPPGMGGRGLVPPPPARGGRPVCEVSALGSGVSGGWGLMRLQGSSGRSCGFRVCRRGSQGLEGPALLTSPATREGHPARQLLATDWLGPLSKEASHSGPRFSRLGNGRVPGAPAEWRSRW